MGLSMTCSPTKPKRPLHAKLSARNRLYMYGRPLRSPYSYMVSISRGAGAELLLEREVSSHNPFLSCCAVALVSHRVQGQSSCRSARCPRTILFFHVVPQAAQHENKRSSARREGLCLNSQYKP